MSGCYLDASVLVSLLLRDPGSEAAHRLVAGAAAPPLVSDFARAEFASAVARLVRMRALSRPAAGEAIDALDGMAERARTCRIESADVAQAEAWLRGLDLNLRTTDALHLAAARRLNATLATLDAGLAEAARRLGVAVAA